MSPTDLIGTKYDGRTIVEVTEVDESDGHLPYQFMLDDGSLVWIPVPQDSKVTDEEMRGGDENLRDPDGWIP